MIDSKPFDTLHGRLPGEGHEVAKTDNEWHGGQGDFFYF
jgi:hypothetical protein